MGLHEDLDHEKFLLTRNIINEKYISSYQFPNNFYNLSIIK